MQRRGMPVYLKDFLAPGGGAWDETKLENYFYEQDVQDILQSGEARMGRLQGVELHKKWTIFSEVCIPFGDAKEKGPERLTGVLSFMRSAQRLAIIMGCTDPREVQGSLLEISGKWPGSWLRAQTPTNQRRYYLSSVRQRGELNPPLLVMFSLSGSLVAARREYGLHL
jgi:hypothetical protein